jgi:hypothetical protein
MNRILALTALAAILSSPAFAAGHGASPHSVVIPPRTDSVVIPPHTDSVVIPPHTDSVVIPPRTNSVVIPPMAATVKPAW